MFNILRIPDEVQILSESGCERDAAVRFEISGGEMKAFLKADSEYVRFLRLHWNCELSSATLTLGDKWCRSYADMQWRQPDCDYYMPWYFMANCGNVTVGCGVKVRPASFVCFTCCEAGVTAWLDVRNGGSGVHLCGRELAMCTFVNEVYENIGAFEATKRFCRVMCTDPILPKEPVYGSNNWYYAYGKSSREEILTDAKLLADLTKGLENRPFMVIDDGWSINRCDGPWLPKENYGDMKTLADEFLKLGVKPGIWIRPLCDQTLAAEHPEMCLAQKNGSSERYLDPTVPEVQEHLREDLRRIKSWGYKLIKHDFSTVDIFGDYGRHLNGSITKHSDWHFADVTKTSAEIVLDFYRLIREETGGIVLIGCNTVGHLCAGLVELQRIGDDTSGRKWGITRAYGVNTLAFRLAQNKAFFMVDADCVGILGKNIPWSLNRQWLDLLARSGSPLFVSCQPGVLDENGLADLRKAYTVASKQADVAEPLDWMHKRIPSKWSINGETVNYDWYTGEPVCEP